MIFRNILFHAFELLSLNLAVAGAQSSESTSLGIVLYNGYEPLDIWGPLELFSSMSRYKNIKLSVISHEIGLVTSKSPPFEADPNTPPPLGLLRFGPQVLATHSFENAPPLDILVVPGGIGNRILEQQNNTAMEDFIAARYPQLQYLLSVCTGAKIIARAGVLEGRRATSSKAVWNSVITYGKNVTWVPDARWVVDDNIWTSSGVTAGIDMVYAFLQHYYSDDRASVQEMLNIIEYAPHQDPHWDPFSIVHNVPGVDKNRSLVDCVSPAGF